MQRISITSALGLAYGAIAVLTQQLAESIEDIEEQAIDDPAMQVVHELREVALPELAVSWVGRIAIDRGSVERGAGEASIDYAIRVLGTVRNRIGTVDTAIAQHFAEQPAEIDLLMTELEDDIVRLDAVELP
jgi:hypothetical protein